MIQLWILSILGMVLSFGVKYLARTNADTKLDVKYWLRDNWFELLLSLIALYILMIVVTDPETGFDQEKFNDLVREKLPSLSWVVLPVKTVVAVGVGYIANTVIYWLVKRKVKSVEK